MEVRLDGFLHKQLYFAARFKENIGLNYTCTIFLIQWILFTVFFSLQMFISILRNGEVSQIQERFSLNF